MNCMTDNICLKALESWFFGAAETIHYCFQSERLPSNSASTHAHRPTFVNSFVMSDCSKSCRARGNKICQSLLQSPPWNCKGSNWKAMLVEGLMKVNLHPYCFGTCERVVWLPGSYNITLKTLCGLFILQGFISHFYLTFRRTRNLFQALYTVKPKTVQTPDIIFYYFFY